MKIYQRYFLGELSKLFFLFLASFYFLYVLIDYSTHTKALHQQGLLVTDVILYYLFQFTTLAEILFPIALTLGTIKVLTNANMRNEIVALTSSGMPYKVVVRPFLICAMVCASLLYLNFQYVTPFVSSQIDHFKNTYLKNVEKKTEEMGSLPLPDGSLLLYQSYDPQIQAFTDLYWIVNSDHVYKIQTLFPFRKEPLAHFVDELKRDAEGKMVVVNSQEKRKMALMKFEEKALSEAVHPPEWQSLSSLFFQKSLWDQAKRKTLLYHKLTIPLLSLLATLAIIPFCLRYKRHLSLFLIYALALFGLITFFMLVNAARILGTSQVLPAVWALFLPYLICFTAFGSRYVTI